MSKKLVALRYAKALVGVVEKDSGLVTTQKELDKIIGMVRNNSDLQRLIFYPLLAPNKRAAVFNNILEAANISKIVRNFFTVVAKAARLNLIYEIASVYSQLVSERIGVIEASVRTAYPLSERQETTLVEVLAHKTNNKVKLKWHRDDSIIGGIKIQIGSMVYDASIQGQLSLLKTKLLLG